MMKNRQPYPSRLSDQILGSLAISLLLAGLTILGVNYRLHKTNLEQKVQTEASIITQSLAKTTSELQQPGQLEKVIQGYKILPNVIEVVILHPDGKPLMSQGQEKMALFYEVSHPEMQPILEESRRTGTEVYHQTTQQGIQVLVHVLPFKSALFGQTNRPGLAVSILNLQTIQQESLQSFLISTTTMLSVALVLLAAMWVVLQKIILRPLTQLTREVANSKDAGYFSMPGAFPNDEMCFLAATFDRVFQECQQAENTLQQRATWLRNQGAILSRLARQRAINQGNLQAAVEEITEAAAETLVVERVSVWLYDGDKAGLQCLDLFEFSPTSKAQRQHSAGLSLSAALYPTYFAAIEAEEKSIAANEAWTDPRTREFCDSYLVPLDIQSMLDVPIRISGQTAGVLCLEQVGQIRCWTPEDESFARSIADLVALALEARDRKRAENVIATSEHQFRTLVSNIPGAVYRCQYDAHCTLDFISDAIYGITGYPAAEFLQNQVRSLASIIHLEDVAYVEQGIQQAIAQQVSYILEYRIIHADGGIRWVSEKGQGIFSEEGELLYLDGLIFDVSDRKSVEMQTIQQAHDLEQTLSELQRTQAQIVQTEKMSSLGQMVAGVAHEINNPVNFIYGNISYANSYIHTLFELLNLYREQYPQPHYSIQQKMDELDLDFVAEDLPKLVTSMQVGAERIRDIVRSLRTFSRLDEAEYKTVNVHQGIDSTLMILHHRLKATSSYPEIQMIKEYGNIPDIECYPGQLNQVFMNILSNAIDALDNCDRHCNANNVYPTSSWIRICTETVGSNKIQIRISDNAPGMSEEVRSQLFDPFFTTKSVGKGTGLGLSISYQVVEKHAGKLFCHSAPGQGAEFVVELPIWGKPPSLVTPKESKVYLPMA